MNLLVDGVPRSPYPGLRPFERNEGDLFFGRAEQIEEMLARLEDHFFLAVVGTSGCGKSSLVRAGLLPALEAGFLFGAGPEWRMAILRPGDAPFSRLSRALLKTDALGQERGTNAQSAAFLEAALRRGPHGLVEAVDESHLPAGTNLLVLVDQFEEIFRNRKEAENAADADAFIHLLLNSVRGHPQEDHESKGVRIYIVLTMRSDFIGECDLFRGLPEAINDSQFLTPRMTPTQYRDAILQPANKLDGSLDGTLVDRLLYERLRLERGDGHHQAPDQLPVLQHALMRMWTMQAAANGAPGRHLTLQDYDKAGGLNRALSEHCDEVLDELDAEQQRIAQVMFRCLCERGSDQRDMRRPERLGAIAKVARVEPHEVVPVVEAFRAEGRNFLMPGVTVPLDEDTLLDISHESLIRQWDNLDTWVLAEAESAKTYIRLEDTATRRAQGLAAPWREVELKVGLQWFEEEKPTPEWALRYGGDFTRAIEFLKLSEAQEIDERRRAEAAREQKLRDAQAKLDAEAELAREQLERAEERRLAEQRQAEEQVERAEVQRLTARRRAEEQARTAQRLARLSVVLVLAFLMALVAGGFALSAKNEADAARDEADAATKKVEDAYRKLVRANKDARAAKERAQEITYASNYKSTRFYLKEADTAIAHMILPGSENPKKAWLYSLEALTRDIGERRLPPRETDRLFDSRLWSRAFRERWSSPALQPVRSVVFSPDGSRLASSAGNTIHLWDVRSGETPVVLEGHESSVHSVTFSQDGTILASGSNDGTVRLWNAGTGELRSILGNTADHGPPVTSVAFSIDGETLASGSSDSLKLWDVETGKLPTIIGEPVESVALSRNGKILAASSATRILLWDLDAKRTDNNASWAPWKTLESHGPSIASVAISPDGRTLVSGSDDHTLGFWDIETGNLRFAIVGHLEPIRSVTFSPDGKTIASGSEDGTVRLWDARTGQPRGTIDGHRGAVLSVAFDPDGAALASGASSGSLHLWSTSTRKAQAMLKGHGAAVRSVALSPDGKTLASASQNVVHLWDVDSGESREVLTGPATSIASIAFDPHGRMLAAGSGKRIHLWDLGAERSVKVTEDSSGTISSVAFSPDGGTLLSGSDDHTLGLWDIETGKLRYSLTGHLAPVRSVAFSRDGKTVAAGAQDGKIRIWDLDSRELVAPSPPDHQEPVSSVAFRRDGSLLASGSGDVIHLWDVDARQSLPTIKGDGAQVRSVAFNHDGKTLASASADDIRLWDTETQTLRAALGGHKDAVRSVAFSHDGKTLVSGSDDHTVRTWDARPSQSPALLQEHGATVWSVAYSRDGKKFASGDDDGIVLLRDLESGQSREVSVGNRKAVTGVAFSEDGKLLVSASGNSVHLMRGDSGEVLTKFDSPVGAVFSVALSADNNTVAASSEKAVVLWTRDSDKPPRLLTSDEADVLSVAFSPDGATVASGASGTIRLWSVSTGEAVHVYEVPRGAAIFSVAFNRDGTALASGAGDGTVRVLDVDSWALRAELKGLSDPISSLAFSPDGTMLASGSTQILQLWNLDTKQLHATHKAHETVTSAAFSADGKTLAFADERRVLGWPRWNWGRFRSIVVPLDTGKPNPVLAGLARRSQEFLSYQLDEDDEFKPSPERLFLTPLNGYEFPEPSKIRGQRRPRPSEKHPIEWLLETMQ